MGLLVSFTAGEWHTSHDCDRAELAVLQTIARSNEDVRNAVALVFGVTVDSSPRAVKAKQLGKAVETILPYLSETTEHAIYSISGIMDGHAFGGARAVSGLRIGGELFSIHGGIGRCVLRKVRVNELGRGENVSEKDIRHFSTLQTDNMGKLRIRRRTNLHHLERGLRRILKALRKLSSDCAIIVEIG
jgi:hypothetical protein